MTTIPFLMPPDEYLIHYLTTAGLDPSEVDGLSERAIAVLELAHDMAVEYSLRFRHFAWLDSYYRGCPPLPEQPKRLTKTYRELLDMSRSNWCSLVVDVVEERLKIGSITSTANPGQDPTAWAWWSDNNMDGASAQIHTAALKFGICYVSVWPGPDNTPRIVGETPMSCYARIDHETDLPTMALRCWLDSSCGCVYADLTLPDYQFRLVSTEAVTDPTVTAEAQVLGVPWQATTLDLSRVQWRYRDDVPPVRVNPFGVVPYVRFLTKPDLMGGFASEIEGIIPIQDRITKTTFDRLLTQEFAAFPQKWVTGIEIPVDPSTGKPREPFNAAVDRVWTLSDPAGKFGQFEAMNPSSYLDAVTSDIQALATQSRTPPHYLVAGMGQFPSGESVRATEYGLTRKVQARQQSYGDAWAQVLRLAGLAAGNAELATDRGLNVVWEDVEARSEGEIVDALLKMGTLGVPWPALWQRWGASPEEIEAWNGELDATIAKAQALAQATSIPRLTKTASAEAVAFTPVERP